MLSCRLKGKHVLVDYDVFERGCSAAISFGEVIYKGRSEFQEIVLLRSKKFGKILVLDNVLQLTERDEFFYHEALVHVPMLAHPRPRKVLIVGGGDGCAAREALKHSCVERIDLVEIDEEVLKLSKRYFSKLNEGSLDNPKVNVIISCGREFLRKCEGSYDVVIVDCNDPFSPVSKRLFSRAFFRSLRKILGNEGIFSMQAGSPFFEYSEISRLVKRAKEFFRIVKPYVCLTPSYGGAWPLLAGSQRHDPEFPSRETRVKTRWYCRDSHLGCFRIISKWLPAARQRGKIK